MAPTNRKIFTLTKAPIAHKNWSKEQYKFQFYKFKISFSVYLKEENNLNIYNKIEAKEFDFLPDNEYKIPEEQCYNMDDNNEDFNLDDL